MPKKWFPCSGLLAVLFLGAGLVSGQDIEPQPKVKSVTVTAESEHSYDAAIEKALRDAARQVAGVVLKSETKVADFELIRDSIYTRVRGYVRTYKVLEKKRGLDNTYIVRVHVEVATGEIADDIPAIKMLIELKGRPRFLVRVKKLSEAKDLSRVWVKGAFNEYLRKSDFSVIDEETWEKTLEREIKRALIDGDTRLAALLELQLRAGYGLNVEGFAEKWEDTAYNIDLTNYKVELGCRVVQRDVAGIVAEAMGVGVVQDRGNLRVVGVRDACRKAVADVFPKLRDGILKKWLEDIDVGRTVIVQVYGASFQIVSDLAERIRGAEGVMKVDAEDVQGGGVSTLRVIGRISAEDIAGKIPTWTGGKLEVRSVTENEVTAGVPRDAAPQTPGGSPQEGGSGETGQFSPEDDRGPPRTPSTRTGVPTALPEPAQASPHYVLPAAIVGGFVLLGIMLAAIILRKK